MQKPTYLKIIVENYEKSYANQGLDGGSSHNPLSLTTTLIFQ